MVRVSDLARLSEVSPDVNVLLTDGEFECRAFSSPCMVKKGDEILDPLHVFGLRSMMLSEGVELGIPAQSEDGLQRIVATILSLEPPMLGVGCFRFEVDDYVPGGLQRGDVVQVECGRIDLW